MSVVVEKSIGRALRCLDAAVKMVIGLGADMIEPDDQWHRVVTFKMRDYEFRLSITERQRRQAYVLTKKANVNQKKYGVTWAQSMIWSYGKLAIAIEWGAQQL